MVQTVRRWLTQSNTYLRPKLLLRPLILEHVSTLLVSKMKQVDAKLYTGGIIARAKLDHINLAEFASWLKTAGVPSTWKLLELPSATHRQHKENTIKSPDMVHH